MVNAGRILILPKGNWDSLTTYDMLDLVTASNNIAYLARQQSVGVNPITDVSNTYWQPFGSTISVDGTTIIVDTNGVISMNIDGDTLYYDSNDNLVKALNALASLSDVNLSTLSNGDALIWDATNGEFINAPISTTYAGLADVNLTSVANGDITKYDSTNQEWVNTQVDALEPTFSEASNRANIASGETISTLFGKIKKWFSDLNTDWSADIGKIEAFMRTSAPDGYLACDGTAYFIADYPLLAELFLNDFGSYNYFGGNGTTTFAVPDLRGEFLRGTGTNGHANQGNGSNVGTHQDGTKHVATQWGYNRPYIGVNSDGEFLGPSDFDTVTKGSAGYSSISGGSYTAAANQYQKTFTSRPTNTSVLYCIRAY